MNALTANTNSSWRASTHRRNATTNLNWRYRDPNATNTANTNPNWRAPHATKTANTNPYRMRTDPMTRRNTGNTRTNTTRSVNGTNASTTGKLDRELGTYLRKDRNFKLFWNRYIASLKFDSGYKDSLTTAFIYLTKILERLNIYITDPRIANIPEQKPFTDIFSVINYNIDMVKGGLEALSSGGLSKEVNYISYHGSPTYVLKRVPNDCIIVIRTPINRLSYYNPELNAQIRDIFNNDSEMQSFFQDPITYGKKNLGNPFAFSNSDIPYYLSAFLFFYI